MSLSAEGAAHLSRVPHLRCSFSDHSLPRPDGQGYELTALRASGYRVWCTLDSTVTGHYWASHGLERASLARAAGSREGLMHTVLTLRKPRRYMTGESCHLCVDWRAAAVWGEFKMGSSI